MHDIIVIGAGSGGLNIAGFMNKAGFKTLLIDKADEAIGGDCLNYGCVPSKALIHVSRLLQGGRDAERFGTRMTGEIDLGKVMDYIKSKQDIIREHENADYFRSIGMDVELGEAKFTGRNEVTINKKRYTAKRIVIATGSRPRELDLPGIDKVDVLTNENIFSLRKLPSNLLIIGGGPIGIELGQAFRRLGSEVTIIQNGPTFLPKERPEVADVLRRRLEKEGVKFLFDTTPVKFISSNEAVVVGKDGKEKIIRFNNLLVSIGRRLNIQNLGLENADIRTTEKGLVVNEYLQTTNKDVYVCGDIAGGYQFTHAAELHAGVIISNFFSPFKKKLSYENLSWVTYTSPEIATFGLSERELKEKGIHFETLTMDFADDDRAIVDEEDNGKLVLFHDRGRFLGGSMVAKDAGELFQELVLAKTAGLKFKDIFNKVYPYPTAARVNKKIIAKEMAKKLTQFNKKMLHMLY